MAGEFPPGAERFLRKLGQAICRKRIVEGLTIAEFVEATGLSIEVVANIESGVHNFPIDLLVPIAIALNCTPNELIELASIETITEQEPISR